MQHQGHEGGGSALPCSPACCSCPAVTQRHLSVAAAVGGMCCDPVLACAVSAACSICILAGDISPVDVITHIPIVCEDNKIPYIFVPSKEVGQITGLTGCGHAGGTHQRMVVCSGSSNSSCAAAAAAADPCLLVVGDVRGASHTSFHQCSSMCRAKVGRGRELGAADEVQ